METEQPILYYRESNVSALILPFYELVQERTTSGISITAILEEIESLGFKGSYSTVRNTVEQLKSKKNRPISTAKRGPEKIIRCFRRFYKQLTAKNH